MERDFETYNKNIDDFDARNIFEYDSLKEVNQDRFNKVENDPESESKKIELYQEDNESGVIFN